MKVDVNTVYPTTIPLATFPPVLLRKLPDLPPELEYRLVAHSLILRDVKANLIVDILRDVVRDDSELILRGRAYHAIPTPHDCAEPWRPGVGRRRHAETRRRAPACRRCRGHRGRGRRSARTRSSSWCSATPAPATAGSTTRPRRSWKAHAVFPYEFAIMLGDNIYGSERPQDFKNKFETPYKPLLDANIPFYAALGNHDDPNQRFYKPFSMNGQRFYTYQKKDVAVLRPRQQLHGQGPAGLAGERTGGLELEMEDRLLPPPALFVRRHARIGSGPAHHHRADVQEVQRQPSSSRATSISTSGSSRRAASTISPPVAPPSCARATFAPAT